MPTVPRTAGGGPCLAASSLPHGPPRVGKQLDLVNGQVSRPPQHRTLLDLYLAAQDERNSFTLDYCDDQIWLSPNMSLIKEYVQKLKDLNYDLTLEDEGGIFDFLGINFKKYGEKIVLTQTGLIDKVLKYTGMDKASTQPTPAACDPWDQTTLENCLTKNGAIVRQLACSSMFAPTQGLICNSVCIKCAALHTSSRSHTAKQSKGSSVI